MSLCRLSSPPAFNIPLNRPVYATTSTLWLLPALSFCTRTISVYVYDDLCRVAKCVCVQCYTIWSMIKGKRNGHKKNPWPSSRYLCALFFSSSACACAFCKEQYRTAGPFCWSLSGVCSRIKPVVKVIYSCGSPFVWNLFFKVAAVRFYQIWQTFNILWTRCS